MTKDEIMVQLKAMGNAQAVKTFTNHGAPVDKMYGVKISDLKTIVKKVKKNHALSLELYATGNSDAMYLAGLIADEKKISKAELQRWAQEASWYMISEYTVAWVAAESPFGWELGLEWIESPEEKIACAGWNTLSGILSLLPDEKLDVAKISALLDRVAREIHGERNRVRYVMNSFVIHVGCAVPSLTDKSMAIGQQIGKVSVDVGNTACKVPSAPDYIQKVAAAGRLGNKKKTVRC